MTTWFDEQVENDLRYNVISSAFDLPAIRPYGMHLSLRKAKSDLSSARSAPVPETNPHGAIWVFIGIDRSDAALKRARHFLTTGELQIRNHPGFLASDASLFSAENDRSFGRQAHGFIAATDWRGAHKVLPDADRRKLVSRVQEMLNTWKSTSTSNSGSRPTMAFHDETTAQRALNLISFRHVYGADLDEECDNLLRAIIEQDLELLTSEDFYAGVNNHGMFQDIALLVASELYDHAIRPDAMRSQAFTRLYEYFSTCYTSDGIHVENNPTYHVMISRYLSQVVTYAELRAAGKEFAKLSSVLSAAEEYAAHAVTPRGMFPPISDTAVRQLDTKSEASVFPGELYRGAITLGREGVVPQERSYIAENTGYAIHRSDWGDPKASYIYFSAAYNADYHKHSDELSLYVMNDGVELIREAGPFGYDRKNPKTGYGFSSQAHNTLLVDGRGLPRTDAKKDLTTLENVNSSPTTLHVRGRTGRYSGVSWTRELVVEDSGAQAPVIVKDSVRSSAEHNYQILWHFGPDITVLARSAAAELFLSDGRKVGELTWSGSAATSVRLTRGQSTPEVQGWAFPRMGESVPATVLTVSFSAADIDVEWSLRTRDFLILDRGVNPVSGAWRSFAGEKPVNYLLEQPSDSVEELHVVFTAVHKPWDFTYNYRASMAGTSAATLYILDDFGDQGAYYLANGRVEAEFRSVQGLLHSIMRQLSIGPDKVTTIGSSKGGSAAILHGVTIGASQVIAAAPQTRIGSFLAKPHPNILRYISGDTTAASIAWVDSVLDRALASGVRSTEIRLLVGRADHHYTRHVQPFVAAARALGYAVQVMPLPGTPHSRIGSAFRSYLASWIKSRNDSGDEPSLPHVAVFDKDSGEIGVATELPSGWKASFRLMRGREVINSAPYHSAGHVSWKVKEAGAYRVRVYARTPDGNTIAFGTSAVRVATEDLA